MNPEATPSPPDQGSPRRVLVVDDEALIRWAASSTLTDVGFAVMEAADVAGARRMLLTVRFDLVLLDVRLPDGDGVTLMQELRLAQPACRFIMMTAFRTPEFTAQATRDHIIVLDKPFDMPQLTSLVGDVMADPHSGAQDIS